MNISTYTLNARELLRSFYYKFFHFRIWKKIDEQREVGQLNKHSMRKQQIFFHLIKLIVTMIISTIDMNDK